MSVVFHILNVFFLSTVWIDRNTVTIFELFCGLLKLFFFPNSPPPLPPTRCVNRNLFYLRLARAWLTMKIATGTVDHHRALASRKKYKGPSFFFSSCNLLLQRTQTQFFVPSKTSIVCFSYWLHVSIRGRVNVTECSVMNSSAGFPRTFSE